MKAIKSTVLVACSFAALFVYAQDSNFPETTTIPSAVSTKKQPSAPRINFYIVNKPKTLDLFSRLVIIRARKHAMTRREKFVVIIASSSKEVRSKMEYELRKKNALIGSLWFDSHGKYVNGYSSFSIGNEEFSYKTINDSGYTQNLRALAEYCDEYTRVAIGSCYSGATYEKPAHGGKPSTRMNGDSLVIGLARILDSATVYGTEGWVMTKPGIFAKNSFALAGFPIQKRFKDEVFKPVWEHMGVWHSYSTSTNSFNTNNTIALTRMGSIHIKSESYLDQEKYRNRQMRNLKKLRHGLLKV